MLHNGIIMGSDGCQDGGDGSGGIGEGASSNSCKKLRSRQNNSTTVVSADVKRQGSALHHDCPEPSLIPHLTPGRLLNVSGSGADASAMNHESIYDVDALIHLPEVTICHPRFSIKPSYRLTTTTRRIFFGIT